MFNELYPYITAICALPAVMDNVMRKKITLFHILIIIVGSAQAQQYFYKPTICEVLQKFPSSNSLEQCSRPKPKGISGFWQPDSLSLTKLFKNFKKVLLIKSTGYQKGLKIDSLHRFDFQFIGLAFKDKKFIYVNAFAKDYSHSNDSLRERVFDMCDGGYDFWGVLFNPITGNFSDLSFNGE